MDSPEILTRRILRLIQACGSVPEKAFYRTMQVH